MVGFIRQFVKVKDVILSECEESSQKWNQYYLDSSLDTECPLRMTKTERKKYD